MSRLLSAALVLSFLLPARISRGEEAKPPRQSLTKEQMAIIMHTYVGGEKQAALPFGVTGVSALIASGVLLSNGSPMAKGAAWPLLVGGVAEVLASTILLVRTDAHREMLDHLLQDHPADFARLETAHLDRIQHTWQPILLGFEGALLVAGGTMAIEGHDHHNDTLQGVGIGLAVQGLALFLLDWAVLDRARGYSAGLQQFTP